MAVPPEKRRVLGMLGLLDNTPLLEEIAADLNLQDLAEIAGDGPRLYLSITAYLMSAEFDQLEEGGMPTLAAIRDKLRPGLGLAPEEEPPALFRDAEPLMRPRPPGFQEGDPLRGNNGGDEENEGGDHPLSDGHNSDESEEDDEDNDGAESDEIKDEFEDAVDDLAKLAETQRKARRNFQRAARAAKAAGLKVNAVGAGFGGLGGTYGGAAGAVGGDVGLVGKFRGLKFDGTIGKPGEKKKLTYRSLKSQIKSAVRQGFSDSEIVSAVIKCMPCGSSLRNLCEEQNDKDKLTVKLLLPTLESYFQQKNATTLYHEMTGAVMSGDDTVLSFCMDLMVLRDTVYKVSRAEGGGYSKELLQAQFQKALYTGIKNERVRQELKPLLHGKVGKGKGKKKRVPTDNEIIAEITEICMIDTEHQAKIEAKTRRGNVSAVVVEADTESDRKSNKGATLDPLVEQFKTILQPLTTSVAQLNGAVEKLNGLNSHTQVSQHQPNVQHQKQNDNSQIHLKQAALQQLQRAQFLQQQQELLQQAQVNKQQKNTQAKQVQEQQQQLPQVPQQPPPQPLMGQQNVQNVYSPQPQQYGGYYNVDDDLYNLLDDPANYIWRQPNPNAFGPNNPTGQNGGNNGGNWNRGGFGRGRGGFGGGRGGRGRGG